MLRSKIDDTHALVRRCGGWETVLRAYPQLQEAMQASPAGMSRAVRCPLRQEGKTVFRLYKDWREKGGGYHNDFGRFGDGIDLIAWLEGCSKTQAMDRIIEICGGDLSSVSVQEAQAVKTDRDNSAQLDEDTKAKNQWVLQKVEREAIHASQAQLALNYLHSRGLGAFQLPSNVGFSYRLKTFGINGETLFLPGLLFYIQKLDGTPVSFHRIFLSEDGYSKSPLVENAKMQLSGLDDVRGSSIQLGNPLMCQDQQGRTRCVLAVCEGPETGMAIMLAEGIPVWCGIASTLMELMDIPECVTDLLIFEDRDRILDGKTIGEGERAGESLMCSIHQELPHITVHRFLPPNPIRQGEKSQDWLDEWNATCTRSFPSFLEREGLTVIGQYARTA
ncbi:toprim domain-containing protein [uncultured Photobacterium sp.]|uniref:DUF7146 domain-containing protein n=1 Tax=uncultured Photobacterium sp. TaxID=173973 RepID=UPI00261E1C24|nr:toprim domain-containing protein [uncultured Photobacterium sp.]